LWKTALSLIWADRCTAKKLYWTEKSQLEFQVACHRSTLPLIKKDTSLKKLSDSYSSPQKVTDSDRNTHPPTTPES
jgi:hypothetical protein